MTDLLNIASAALRAAQAGLGIAADNVANADTPGRVRRQVIQAAGTAGQPMTPLGRSPVAGGGVDVTGLRRVVDRFRIADDRQAIADSSRAVAREAGLDRTLLALESEGQDAGRGIGSLFDAASALAAAPSDETARDGFLAAAAEVTDRFNRTDAALAAIDADLTGAATSAIASANALLTRIAGLNDTLRRSAAGTDAAATLADSRDAALDELAALLPVSTTETTSGMTDIRLGPDGPLLVTGPVSKGLALAPDGIDVITDPYGTPLRQPPPASGELAGLADARRGLAATRASLDSLAADFASAADPSAALSGSAALLSLLAGRETGFEQHFERIVTGIAARLQSTRDLSGALQSVRSATGAAREAVGQVNLDEEAADIVRLQQAYQAATRIIGVARELFDTLVRAA